MRKFKLATLVEFERAVMLCAQDDHAQREQAVTILQQLQLRATQLTVTDPALYAKIKESRRHRDEIRVNKELVEKAEQEKYQ
jgi:aspartate carbamoyltransferase regulatory subunit